MGNCSGHWNNWNKNDKGKFERNDHKSKFGHKDSCKSCGHHDSDCKCKSQPVRQHTAPLSDCVLLNSVVCSKKLQKVAELQVPISSLFDIDDATEITPELIAEILAAIASITVTPDLNGIVINRRVIRDKVINMGFVPVTVTPTLLPGVTLPDGVDLIVGGASFNLPFQEHSDCPGACPEDTAIETPFVLEATFAQTGGSVLAVGLGGFGIFVTGVVLKAIFRTTLTVTRQVIVDGHGNVCDVEDRRCEPPTVAPNFSLLPPGTGTGLGGL